MDDPFSNMHQMLLAGPLGEDALFRGQPLRVQVDRAFKVFGEYGQVTGKRVVVSIPASLSPNQGDDITLLKTSDTWQFDVLDEEQSDEYVHAWIVRPA